MDGMQITRRIFALSLALAACGRTEGARRAGARACPVKQVLFVCQFGSVKSAIAREHFRKAALDRKVEVKAISRGLTPEEHLSPKLSGELAADGIDAKAEPLRQLSADDVVASEIVVFFDPLPEDELKLWKGG